MRINGIVLKTSCLVLAVLLFWYLCSVFNDPAGSGRGIPEQPAGDAGIMGGGSRHSRPAQASREYSSGSGSGYKQESGAGSGASTVREEPPPAVPPPMTGIPEYGERVDMETNPATGEVHYSLSDPEKAQSPESPAGMPQNVEPVDMEINPQTGEVYYPLPESEQVGSTESQAGRTQDGESVDVAVDPTTGDVHYTLPEPGDLQ